MLASLCHLDILEELDISVSITRAFPSGVVPTVVNAKYHLPLGGCQ